MCPEDNPVTGIRQDEPVEPRDNYASLSYGAGIVGAEPQVLSVRHHVGALPV